MKDVLIAISGNLAAMFFGLEIPSLDIKIKARNPQNPHCGHVMDKQSEGEGVYCCSDFGCVQWGVAYQEDGEWLFDDSE